MSLTLIGSLCALGTALTWALVSLMGRHLAARMSPATVNLVRTGIGGFLLMALLFVRGEQGALLRTPAWVYLLLVGSVATALVLGDTLFFESTQHIGVGRALTIAMSYPLLSTGLAVLITGERLSPLRLLGILITLFGLYLIIGLRPGAGKGQPARESRGVSLAIVAAVSWGIAPVIMKPALAEIDPLTASAIRLGAAAILLGATPWARGSTKLLLSGGPRIHAAVGGIGALTALTTILFVAGIKFAGVAIGTVLSSTSPLFAVPLEALLLGERLVPRTILGAVVTVLGIALMEL